MLSVHYSDQLDWNEFVFHVRSSIIDDGVLCIRDFASDQNNTLLVRLSHALGSVTVEGVNVEGNILENGFIHRVEEREHPLTDKYGFPIISTTAERFLCHTDHYFARHPADVVMFQCVRDDPSGGDSLVAYLRDLLRVLPDRYERTLREPLFPAQFGQVPIVYAVGEETRIRYNRLEVARAAAVTGVALAATCIEALDALDRAIEATQIRFHLNQGECLVLNNHTVVHGRTPLSSNSARLFKRVRLSL